jgi:Family of unknown function (DUF5995)
MANTIDDVLAELQAIIDTSEQQNDRTGYFAALYYKVTARVKEGIANGEFQDGARMERLDVAFANRYLDARRQYIAGQPVTDSWRVAFDTAKRSPALVLQHLLLGINAHINLDLGVAAAQIAPNQSYTNLRNDFNAINTIISSLTYTVLNEITRVSPLLSLLGLHATNNTSILIQFSIGNARDGAWAFGEELASKSGNDFHTCIVARDNTIAQLARSLVHTKGLLTFTIWLIHLFEWKSPAKIIKVLHEAQKTRMKKEDFAA